MFDFVFLFVDKINYAFCSIKYDDFFLSDFFFWFNLMHINIWGLNLLITVHIYAHLNT